jgi:hypothetical protein
MIRNLLSLGQFRIAHVTDGRMKCGALHWVDEWEGRVDFREWEG